jgi:hypothetical protein
LSALFFFRQANAPVRVFDNLPAHLHFSREFYERAASRLAQPERRRDLTKTLRPA